VIFLSVIFGTQCVSKPRDGLFIIIISISIIGFGVLTAVIMKNLIFWLVRRKKADISEEHIASICSRKTCKKVARKQMLLATYFRVGFLLGLILDSETGTDIFL
jgi:hypothetical protein